MLLGHRVSRAVSPDALGPDARNTVHPEALATWLAGRRGRKALSCADLGGAALPEGSFMLTLDDGYRDNLTEALPILEGHEVPVLIFVTTGFIGGETEPAETTVARLVEAAEVLHTPGGRELSCAGPVEKRRVYETLRLQLKKGGVSKRNRLLAELRQCNHGAAAKHAETFLSWDEVCELDRHPLVTIGAHTLTHPLLTRASWREAEHELRESRELLEAHLGHPVLAFAYPYGGHNLWVRRLVARAGFRLAFTTEPQPLRHPVSRRPLRIPRRDLVQAIGKDAA